VVGLGKSTRKGATGMRDLLGLGKSARVRNLFSVSTAQVDKSSRRLLYKGSFKLFLMVHVGIFKA
jgi:hypothetical protein